MSINNIVNSNNSNLPIQPKPEGFWSSIKRTSCAIGRVVGNLSNFGRMNLWIFSQAKEISPYFSYMTVIPAFSDSRIITGINVAFSGIVAYAISKELAVLSQLMPTIEDRLQIDAALLLTSSVYSLINLIESIRSLKNSAVNDPERKIDNQSLLIKMSYLGLSSFYFLSNCGKINQYIQSVQLYYQLDNIQQRAALQFRSIDKLSGEKSCNAIIIDNSLRYPTNREEVELFVDKVIKDPSEGDFMRPIGSFFLPDEAKIKLYEKCHVLAYTPRSLNELTENLVDSVNHFNSADILMFTAHGKPDTIAITTFLQLTKENVYPNSQLIKTINSVLSPNAQIFLESCNPGCGENNLASVFSTSLPGKTITASGASYYVNKIKVDYDEINKKLNIENYSLKSCLGPEDPTVNQMRTFYTPL